MQPAMPHPAPHPTHPSGGAASRNDAADVHGPSRVVQSPTPCHGQILSAGKERAEKFACTGIQCSTGAGQAFHRAIPSVYDLVTTVECRASELGRGEGGAWLDLYAAAGWPPIVVDDRGRWHALDGFAGALRAALEDALAAWRCASRPVFVPAPSPYAA